MKQRLEKMRKWMWYPGDNECRLMRDIGCQRYYRDAIIPPFWKTDDCFDIVTFRREFELSSDDAVTIEAMGKMSVTLDDPDAPAEFPPVLDGFTGVLPLKKGKHRLDIRVYNPVSVPAISINGCELKTDGEWLVTCDNIHYSRVSTGAKPDGIRFKTKVVEAKKIEGHETDVYDFGAETMGCICFSVFSGKGETCIYYGESMEESLDTAACELTDKIKVKKSGKHKTPLAKAFRYVNIVCGGDVVIGDVKGISEYSDIKNKGGFVCGDELLNKIYEVSVKTLHLCTREFFIDGIKRDRWVWSGDAYQSNLMNYYSFNDNATVKRTLLALAGKEPVTTHINTIVDYTFFWIIGFAEYFERSGDIEFCNQFLHKAISYMEFCVARANKRGLIEGLSGDWVFVDWAAGLDNTGELAYENILYYHALKKMGEICLVLGDAKQDKYNSLAAEILEKILDVFWDEKNQCFLYNAKNGIALPAIKRQPNIIAVLYDIVPPEKQRAIAKNVLTNENIDAITTPYMRFFELSALAKIGKIEIVINEIKSYWGGMLSEGATSFWETYDPNARGTEHYVMYGRKYGKSLCHAWGASPVYLFGRYVAGVESVSGKPGQFSTKPYIDMSYTANVPLEKGSVEITVTDKDVVITTKNSCGEAEVAGTKYKIGKNRKLLISKQNRNGGA